MKRRKFIFLSSGLTLSGLIGYQLLKITPEQRLKEYLSSLKSTQNIGYQYINQSKSNTNYFIKLLDQITKYQDKYQTKSIAQAVKELIIDDYQNNRLCNVNGWQLSETECLLAASYVSLFKPVKKEKVVKTFENAKEESFLQITHWGPQKTMKGEIFNQQSDGHAGIWLLAKDPPPNLIMYIDGRAESTFVAGSSITSGVHNLNKVEEFINTVGLHEIYIYDDINHKKQFIGNFEVLPQPKRLIYDDGTVSQSFCPISSWGPQIVEENKPFNKQPNGHSALWIKTECASKNVKVLINNISLKTTILPGIVTASIDHNDLKMINNRYQVELFDPKSQERLIVGEMKMQ